MTRMLALTAAPALLLAACTGDGGEAQAPAAAAGPATPEQALFLKECGLCHLQGGTGTMMLAQRLGEDRALLEERDDLSPDYVALVVRNGINSMPTITRVEVTDEELSDIAFHLTGARPAEAAR